MARKSKKAQEQENIRDLFLKFQQTRDKKTRDLLVEKNLYIAEILAKKYIGKGIEYDDLYQVACIGLIYAIDRYNPEKGFEFSSYATPTIVGEIKKYFRDKGWVIRVPRRIQELNKKVSDAKTYLSQTMQKSPTVEDIADYLSITNEEVLEVLEGAKVYAPQSLDQSVDQTNDDKETNLNELIGAEDKDMLRFENRDLINRCMANLNTVEKKILLGRYFDNKTQISIAKELEISQMTVSRMEKKILKKFKAAMKEQMEY
ncbi:SigB/SigF/SigG family RNA polymerase sigma factor [uncultured Finegoldia sp.]|uniref:SigB/SigF/SigG family RNA polymerase sigma factor n=1 Tax=uncultured Finegoldia sp. TaxID=328009 RepID=UPI002603A6DC|nr:SigB/SigF/SigG family RNA polymerase sigma factor [uncultured Finegoldia sp.]